MGILDSVLSYFTAKRLRQEKKTEEKLRTHFEDIEKQVISKIIGMSNNLFEDDEEYTCFKLHFPEEAKEWEQLKERNVKQNQSAEDFESRIKEYIGTDHNLPPLKKESTGIEEMIIDVTPKCLCQTLHDLAQSSSLVYDFNKAEIKRIDSFYVLHFPNVVIGASQLVYAKTVEKVEYSKSVLVRIQESPDFKQEASHIFHNKEKLAKDSKDFAQRLAKKAEHIGKYQIGSKEFNKLNKCPICRKF